MSSVRYKLGFYIPEDGVLYSHRREDLSSCRDYNMSVDGEEKVLETCKLFWLVWKSLSGVHLNRQTILKNGVFWVVTPCGSCKNRRFGGTWRLLHQGDKNR
jgi:hypothetical protein